MTERFTYNSEVALPLLGLTREDIDSRAVLAVGYDQEELLPPYQDKAHQQRAKSILDYVKFIFTIHDSTWTCKFYYAKSKQFISWK